MDGEQDDPYLLGVGGGLSSLASSAPVPRRGQHREFDSYCDQVIDDEVADDREALHEMRRALWATWKTKAPTPREVPTAQHDDEDEQLARAIEESKRSAMHGSRPESPITILDDDDDELQRAIAASAEQAREPKRPRREETPEEERRMLAEAMAASLAEPKQETTHEVSDDDEDLTKANQAFQASREAFRAEERKRREAKANSTGTATPPRPATPKAESSASGAASATATEPSGPLAPAPRLGLGGVLGDRAQMEKERLARQAARQAAAGSASAQTSQASQASQASASSSSRPAPLERNTKVATLSDLQPTVISPTRSAYKAPRAAGSSRPAAASAHPLQSPGPFPTDAAGEYYPDGEVRHVALSIGGPSDQPTFSPQQVVGNKKQIALIIMSSFVVDEEWLEGILPPAAQVPRIVCRPHPREHHPAWNGKVQAQSNGEIRCYPQMVGEWGSAHMKFFWIFYKTGRLRVAISTANMVHYDWDWIENTVFVQDFLQKPPGPTSPSTSIADDFSARFRYLFVHLKVHKALRFLKDSHPHGSQIPFTPNDGFEDLSKWDWSKVRVRLVMSIPGTYSGMDKMDDFGLCRLGRVLNESGWKPKRDEIVVAEYQGSSLGSYTIDWFDTFYQYCSGKTTQALLGRSKPGRFPPLKVIFPTLATVDKSHLKREGGGTMFCGKAFSPITKHLFHDANSKRGGVLMHSKVLIGLFEPRPENMLVQGSSRGAASGKRKADDIADENEGVGGWAYIGSHNFSPAAWGTVNVKKTPPTLNVRNYELGIVFPLPRKNASAAADAIAPHQRPARPYSPTDVPWDQKLQDIPA